MCCLAAGGQVEVCRVAVVQPWLSLSCCARSLPFILPMAPCHACLLCLVPHTVAHPPSVMTLARRLACSHVLPTPADCGCDVLWDYLLHPAHHPSHPQPLLLVALQRKEVTGCDLSSRKLVALYTHSRVRRSKSCSQQALCTMQHVPPEALPLDCMAFTYQPRFVLSLPGNPAAVRPAPASSC